ncbi:MAG: YHYH protein, partial [Verrucomicrobia bacterium]|nr:YHYH protein [Verrucomicrobiota bacterium]
MSPTKKIPQIIGVAASLAISCISTFAADPQLESWQTANTRRYARIYQTDAARLAGTAVTTWTRGTTSQTTPSYAGVIQVSSSASWVYLRTTGLGTHVMGPWYLNTAKTQNFPSFPANSGTLVRFPRTPTIPAAKTLTPAGPIGYFVDGVAAYDNRDTFSYTNASGADGSPMGGGRGDGVWNREAYANEGVTFDPAFAHQAMTSHHYHANAPAVRFALGDHVEFNPATKIYTESTAPVTKHSPIVAWLADGLPVYGPFGYASPMNAASGVRRMTPGFVKRDGTNGTTNLASTGRTTLPAWAARVQNRSATLPTNA